MTQPSPKTELPSDLAFAALSAAGVGTWSWEIATGHLCGSPETADMLGVAHEDFPATLEAYLKLVDPADRARVRSRVAQIASRGGRDTRWEIEHRIRRSDGAARWIELRGGVAVNREGQPQRLIGVAQDVTARVDRQAARDDASRSLQVLLNNLPGAAYRCLNNRSWTMLFLSHKVTELTGYEPAELLGDQSLSYADLIHPEDRLHVWQEVQQALAADRPFTLTYRIRCRDGLVKWVWEQGCKVDREEYGQTVLEGFIADMTAQKEAEQALRDSEQRFVAFMDHLPAAAVIKDASSQLVFANRYFVEEFAVSEWYGKRCSDLFPGEVAEQLMAIDQRTLSEGSATTTLELPHRDGRLHIYRVEEFSIPQQERHRPLLAAIAIDVTDLVRVERQLDEEIRRNRQLLETTIDGYILADTEGRLVDVNPSYCRMVGYDRAELLKMNIRQLECALKPDQVGEKIEQMVSEGSARFETQHRTKDGRVIDLEVSITVLGSESQRLVAAFVHDVTAKKQTEESLRAREAELAHVARLSTLGEMVAGIAHEVNQPLHAIANFATGALVRLDQGGRSVGALRPNLERIAEQARLAADILSKYRQFARRHRAERKSVPIDEIVRQATQLMVFDLREHQVDLNVHVPSPSPNVAVVANEICQVLVNLLRNACEAMDQTDPRQRSITIDIEMENSYVKVAVRDRGQGLADGGLERWIAPFETTKPEGLGMGLAVSSRIVEDHGGAFWAEANRDAPGTTFYFTLPGAEHGERRVS